MKNNRQALWFALAFASMCGVIWEFYPLPDAAERLAKVPKAGIGFASTDIQLLPDEKEILSGANVLRREYFLRNGSILVTVIDGTRNRHAVHDPFYCIRGSGWQIISQHSLPIRGGEAKLVRVAKEGREAEALIWFSDGRVRHASAMRYWWQTTLRRLSLGFSGPEPVLVNIQSGTAQAFNWARLHEDFPAVFGL